ncbi:MAG: L,D-transpeptidase [Verrucomicrobiota bacterium]
MTTENTEGTKGGEDPALGCGGGALLRVDVASQTVSLLENGEVRKRWPVSTSKFGLGFASGSFKTPTGRFAVAEKIGAGAPPWSEFKSRQPTGRIAEPGGEEDGVLTRILWLEGLDSENANTQERYIYFHGTNREDLIGTPASHGCVRLRNGDMVELFDLVPEGAAVEIV